MERITGVDAYIWHLERIAPMHTLKVVILDTSNRPVSREDVVRAIERAIPVLPRLRQRLVAPPVLEARPFWVECEVDIAAHVDERELASPGDRRCFDEVMSDLASADLPKQRPLWAATIVRGLEGGRTAIAFRVHHVVMDGMAAVNLFTALTTDGPGHHPPILDVPAGPLPRRSYTRWTLVRAVLRDVPRLAFGVRPLVRRFADSTRATRLYRRQHGMPSLLKVKPNSLNGRFGRQRLAASAVFDFADLQAIRQRSGGTINGVLHGAIAGALRRELLRRGERVGDRLVASFGIASDPPGVMRLMGNNLTATFVALAADVDDPVERLLSTIEAAKRGVEVRKAAGVDLQPEVMQYVPRAFPFAVDVLGRYFAGGHVVTANVPGPREDRWLGDIEVVEFLSFAVVVPPMGVNITCYTYAGRLEVGMLVSPEKVPDPHRLLEDLGEEIRLLRRVAEERLPVAATA